MHKVVTTRIYFVLCALFTLPVFGCGDDGTKDPEPTPPAAGGSGGGGGAPATGEVLADCELASTADPTIHDGYFKHPTKGWELAWFTYTDNVDAAAQGKPPGTITPAEGAGFVCVQDADATRSFVFNAKGGPFNQWGAGMGFNMQIMGTMPPGNTDLSAYKGIKFWAKVNAATTGSVRVKLVDVQTTPTGAQGGSCTAANGACNNNFGFVLSTISTSWAQFTVPFSDMKQETWSSEMFATPQLSKVIGFQFQVGKTSFDYSVDNFELYQ